MNGLVTVAEGVAGTVSLSDTFTKIVGDLGPQFAGAVPTVATTAGVIVAIMIGVPLVVKLFRRLVG